jgi:hypothetical protein
VNELTPDSNDLSTSPRQLKKPRKQNLRIVSVKVTTQEKLKLKKERVRRESRQGCSNIMHKKLKRQQDQRIKKRK